jgi:hypothetical protein
MIATMTARDLLAFLCGAATLLACGAVTPEPSHSRDEAAGGQQTAPARLPVVAAKHRGVSWVAGPREVTREDLLPLVAHGVDWIVQTPFGWQQAADSPQVTLITEGRVMWGERDAGLETTTRLAHELGIKTLLKPHLWLRGGASRLDIAMTSEADWRAWFDSYATFILHYAALAERLGIEGLCIGTELHRTAVERPEEWRALIARIRAIYGGELTYAANWWREYEEVPFWDALDAIGIQAYFPLSDAAHPSVEELMAGWQRHLPAIEAVSRRYGKPVLFTEIGYKSTAGGAAKPWEWPERSGIDTLVPDDALQANAYEAFFRTVWDRPWFAGAYFWKWFPGDLWAPVDGSLVVDFSPQGKPAAAVMRRWYEAGRP